MLRERTSPPSIMRHNPSITMADDSGTNNAMMHEHMFPWSIKSAGMLKLKSQNKVCIALTYPPTVEEQGIWSIMSCLIKHAIILSYPGSFPQGSGICFCLMKFTYTACLNLAVSRSESDISLDIFASTISPEWARLALDSAGRKCKLSIPHVPAGGWHSHRKQWEGDIELVGMSFLSLGILSTITFSIMLIHFALMSMFDPIKRPQKTCPSSPNH